MSEHNLWPREPWNIWRHRNLSEQSEVVDLILERNLRISSTRTANIFRTARKLFQSKREFAEKFLRIFHSRSERKNHFRYQCISTNPCGANESTSSVDYSAQCLQALGSLVPIHQTINRSMMDRNEASHYAHPRRRKLNFLQA
jgi:hypothetical protein